MNRHDSDALTAPAIKKGRKYDDVLAGAREVFMREGYEGAGVDAIARAAGVSKATLYSYFPDKKLLFLEVARAECLRLAETALLTDGGCQSPERTLTEIGRRLTGFLLSDFGQRVFRICVAEAERFPEIGRTFYRSGPLMARKRLVGYLQGAVARGELAIEDCELAADQFAELCKADLFPRLVFNITPRPGPEEAERVVRGAVETFLARYGAPAR